MINFFRKKEERQPQPIRTWKCKKCGAVVNNIEVRENHYACPHCGAYVRIHAYRRIWLLADEGSFEEWDPVMEAVNPLNFPQYELKIWEAQQSTELNEAIVTGKITMDGIPCAIGVCDARFLMSSMGHDMGEKIARLAERAAREKLPLIIFAASGGARMQEGIISLMQMAKTSEALETLKESGQLFISVLTDPTYGGVTASFATLGDIILAEPGAMIGFTGARVIQQTIGGKLPPDFQRAEYQMEHGMIDAIVSREDLRDTLIHLLRLHTESAQTIPGVHPAEKAGASGTAAASAAGLNFAKLSDAGSSSEAEKAESGGKSTRDSLSAWEHVKISRAKDRAHAQDYIDALFPDFFELHGDRFYGDDGAVIGGIATFQGTPVTVIGVQKGRNLAENRVRNFGMPNPEGYRKALRLIKEAERFHRPVITLVDTPGAYPGVGAEERGQGLAIAQNLQQLSALEVPILAVIIGEGSSGGALGLATANEVWMLENAVYSILSPEGFASILYRDAKKHEFAAEEMKMTSSDLLRLGVVERVIPEKEPVTPGNLSEVTDLMVPLIGDFLSRYGSMTGKELRAQRYERFRRF